MADTDHTRAGLFYGIGAYALWGVLPLYLHLLKDVPPAQVLSHAFCGRCCCSPQ